MNNQSTQTNYILPQIKKRIMVLSGKGGVGKSTISLNIAYGLIMSGFKVGILDADIHGPSIAKLTNSRNLRIGFSPEGKIIPVTVNDNLTVLSIANMLDNEDAPIVWRGPMKMSALKDMTENTLWPELDYLIIDCPPGTGDEPLSIAQLLGKVDGAVVVTTAQDVAIQDVRKSISFIQALNIPILGIVENMSSMICPHCNGSISLYQGEGLDKLIFDFQLDLLASIDFDARITLACENERPFIYDYNKSAIAENMQKMISTIIEKINN